jgi:uridine monophosphate synthetase
MNKQQLLHQLHKIGCIKTGHFTLKSGLTSPIYLDMRQIISYPTLLQAVADHLWQTIKDYQPDLLCGVPYTALPIATAMSLAHEIPMVMRRKEIKAYGTKQQVEGNFYLNQPCYIIEDVVTTGSSILETVADLQSVGLQVPYVATFIDREQGGKDALAEHGIHLVSVLTLTEIMDELKLELPPLPNT